jgi:hypothetical protein
MGKVNDRLPELVDRREKVDDRTLKLVDRIQKPDDRQSGKAGKSSILIE